MTRQVNVPRVPIRVRTRTRISGFDLQSLRRPRIAPFQLHILHHHLKGHLHLIPPIVILLISPHAPEMPWR